MQLIWEEFLKLIKEEAGSQVVETWFKAVTLDGWDTTTHTTTLTCPNQFVSKWIEEHYIPLIKTHLARLLHSPTVHVRLTCKNHMPKRNIIPASMAHVEQEQLQEKKSQQIIQPAVSSHTQPLHQPAVQKNKSSLVRVSPKVTDQLQSSYVFDRFVVGPSNSLAHAAAHAICENPGGMYNPLFIYGGTGLGKTHLLHAIGNETRQLNSSLTVRYETSDHFINDFISSIRLDRIQQFRARYQAIDVLLVDDIQFLSNKGQTQEAFFHIFNTLHEQGKQIVLSSDTFPKEIPGIQNRLKSRMEWGLVADVQMPSLETKIAILKKKAEQHNIKLPSNVSEFIASRIVSNIRELEGALIRVSAFATLTNEPISIEMTRKVLITLSEKKSSDIQLETVLKTVAKHYGTSIHDIKSKKRHHEVALVRQVVLYLMKKLTLHSLQTIGKYVGGRDHSTVIHAIGKVESRLKYEHAFSQKIKLIEQEITMN